MKNSGAAPRYRYHSRKDVASPASRSTARASALRKPPSARQPVQHVWHHRSRRDPGRTIPARRTSSCKPRFAGQAGARYPRARFRRRTESPAPPGKRARSRSGATTPGSRPRTAAGSMRTDISITRGRADDVIISAGWTIGAVEVENMLLKHPAVREAAVIGVPDAMRGQVVKAFVVADRVAGCRLRQGNAGFRPCTAQPARISAPDRFRRRTAEDTRRAKSIAKCCASAKHLSATD